MNTRLHIRFKEIINIINDVVRKILAYVYKQTQQLILFTEGTCAYKDTFAEF